MEQESGHSLGAGKFNRATAASGVNVVGVNKESPAHLSGGAEFRAYA